MRPVLFLAFALMLVASCSNRRYLILKEYRASLPPDSSQPLKGANVFLQAFGDEHNVLVPWRESFPTEVPDFVSQSLSDEDEDRWEADLRQALVGRTYKDCGVVGWTRSPTGAHAGNVYAVNTPSEWLRDNIRLELEAMGASIVDEVSAATIQIGGTIRAMKLNMAPESEAYLVVDIDVTTAKDKKSRRRYHVAHEQTSWTLGNIDGYEVLHACNSQLMRLFVPDLLAQYRSH